MDFSIVVCTNNESGIGYYNKNDKKYSIPWNNKEDMKFFKQLTTYSKENELNAVIMGKNTYNSLPFKFLHNRINIVITSNKDDIENSNIISFPKFIDSLLYCKNKNIKKIFVIGGSKLYREALNSEYLESIYWNIENNNNKCNINFPLSFQDALLYYSIDSNYEYSTMNNDKLKYYKLNRK
jgi:dihydrofolate reductase